MAENNARLTTGLVRAGFVAMVLAMAWNQPAWDLTATYVAGRLVASGQIDVLYDQTKGNSAMRVGSAWSDAAMRGGITDRVVTPYIQTPLWAWLVSPLAATLSFAVFKRLFAVATALATAAMLDIAAAQWAPRMASPAWQAALLAGLTVSTPFLAGTILGQSHVLFLLAAVAAAARCLHGRQVSAGMLLAVSVAVKITPIWIALTWLLAGRKRAVASFILASAVLAGSAVAVAGWSTFCVYLRTLEGLGRSAVLSFNNDSLATVLLASRLNTDTAFGFKVLTMPNWVAGVSVLATALCATLGGLLDRRHATRQVGAILCLVGATCFTPLAWNHYFILLAIPVMLFLDAAEGRRKAIWMSLAFIVIILNMAPIAYSVGDKLSSVAIRSHFWAAMLCLAGLPFLSAKPALTSLSIPRQHT